MPARRLVVSTYIQYIALALGAVLLVVFVRQLSGVLLTFLAAGVLAYVLNPVVRILENWRVPRTLAVVGVFLVLILATVAALLVIVVPAVGQVSSIVEDPENIVRQANGLAEQAQELPFVGQYVTELDQDRVLQLLRSNAPSAGQVVDVATGVVGGV
nr:AI-2E family transporter [Actinomycetota bacterium]